jgi:hypothetical protein
LDPFQVVVVDLLDLLVEVVEVGFQDLLVEVVEVEFQGLQEEVAEEEYQGLQAEVVAVELHQDLVVEVGFLLQGLLEEVEFLNPFQAGVEFHQEVEEEQRQQF